MSGLTPQQRGREWEEKFARLVGGKLTPGSGNKWFAKLDTQDAKFLWSCKATGNASHPLSVEIMREVIDAVEGPGGLGSEYTPGAAFQIEQDGVKHEYVAFRLEDFLRIVQEKLAYVPQSKSEAKRERSTIPKLFRES